MLLAILTGFTATLLGGRRPGVGPVLFGVTSNHGVHVGDVPVIGLWLLGLAFGALLWRDSRH